MIKLKFKIYHVVRLATRQDRAITYDGMHKTEQAAQDWIRNLDPRNLEKYKVISKITDSSQWTDPQELIKEGYEIIQ